MKTLQTKQTTPRRFSPATVALAAMLAASVALGSCSKSEPEPTPVAADGTIRAVASVQKSIEVDTKVPYVATSAEGLQVFVTAVAVDGINDNRVTYGTMTFKADTKEEDAVTFDTGFTGSNFLPLDNLEVALTAAYPATEWIVDDYGSSSMIFTGYQDLMACFDVRIARKSETLPVFGTFAMTHWLTRFDITAKAADVAAQAAWGKIKSIAFRHGDGSEFFDKQMLNVFDSDIECINHLTKWLSYQITKSVDKTVYTDTQFDAADFASSLALTTTATPVCYTMMAPVDATAATNEIVLEITTLDKEGGADIVTEVDIDIDPATLPSGSTTGVFFSVNLTFKVKEIKAIASITPWSTPVVIDKVID